MKKLTLAIHNLLKTTNNNELRTSPSGSVLISNKFKKKPVKKNQSRNKLSLKAPRNHSKITSNKLSFIKIQS